MALRDSPPAFESTEWFLALDLAERASLWKRGQLRGSAAGDGAERARHQLEQWRALAPFAAGEWLPTRLAACGLDESTFETLLVARPGPPLGDPGGAPSWHSILESAYAENGAGPGDPPEEPGEPGGVDPLSGFLVFVGPLLRRARRRLRLGIREIARSGLGPFADAAEAERLLFQSLPPRLLWMIRRTLVLETNVARMRGDLPGDTPEERFRGFVERLAQPNVAIPLLREYPVLARQAVERAELWLAAALEFLRRITADWDDVRSLLPGAADPGPIATVGFGAGDSHCAGRSVAILEFRSGARVVYKPRPLAMDCRAQDLLAWLNERGAPGFRPIRILDRGDYGWVEYIEAAPCRTKEEVELYHRRLGTLLAVLYALGGVDVHFENLVAAGDQPVAVDLETMFHPVPPRLASERPDERLAGRTLTESVLRVGLLPLRLGEDPDDPGADRSGMAAVSEQMSRDPVLQWEAPGSDEVRAVKKQVRMEGGKNRPTLEGRVVDVADHIDEVLEGFESGYRLLVRERAALLAQGGPLDAFAEAPGRIVLRATRAYGLLLEESWHPDFLRDALDRDRFFDRLWGGVAEVPRLVRVVEHERRDLWAGDVPYFSTRPGSRDVWAADGTRIADFLEEPPLEGVRRRIAAMGEDDLRRQSWLARTSLGTLLLNRESGEWGEYLLEDSGVAPDGEALRARLLAAAAVLGSWFDRMAAREGEETTWITLDLRERVWSLFPCSEDLYAGVPGICLFLGYLAGVSGERRHADLARRGMRTLSRRLDHAAGEVRGIGLFQGWGGVIYALAHLGRLLDDPGLLADAERRFDAVAERLESDEELDVVGGAAGAIPALLAHHAASGSPRALDLARACGERMLLVAQAAGEGLWWRTRLGGGEPQVGFAHGAAGIATSLLALASATRDGRYREAARGAFAFERGRIWPRLGDWIAEDEAAPAGRRSSQAERELPLSWCYGAPGVGLSRLALLRDVEDTAARGEVERAAALTLERGLGRNHCLCHGDLGNLDFLARAEALGCAAVPPGTAARLARAVVASIERDGWRCGTVAGVESPGLMNGLAGIGYGLLRLADPARVPSVLVMEPPAP